jgi:hypothetical protein
MKIKWVARIFNKKRDKLTNNEFHEIIAWNPLELLKELEKTNNKAWVEIEKIEILRKIDSDLLIRTTKDLTIKEVG